MKKLKPEELPPDELCIAIRMKHDLSQEELGKLVGCTGHTVLRWEKKKARPLRIYRRQLVKIYNEGPPT